MNYREELGMFNGTVALCVGHWWWDKMKASNDEVASTEVGVLMPGGVVVAQGTLDPLTLVRIQAGQPEAVIRWQDRALMVCFS